MSSPYFMFEDYTQLTSFKYIDKVKTITLPLSQLGIGYFSYVEYDQQGVVLTLLNNENVAQAYLVNKWYLMDCLNFSLYTSAPGIYLWNAINQPNFKNLREMVEKSLSIYHGCSIVRISEGTKKIYNFAVYQPQNIDIQNFYFNRYELLQTYIRYFENKASHLITTSDRLIVPNFSLLQPFTNCSCITDKHEQDFLRKVADGDNYTLSPREAECLQLIATTGKSTKQIATLLNLSNKTIESYIRNLKIKLRCHTKAELVIKALTRNIVKR